MAKQLCWIPFAAQIQLKHVILVKNSIALMYICELIPHL